MSWNWKPSNITSSETSNNIDNTNNTSWEDNWTIHSSEMEEPEEWMEVSIPETTSTINYSYERTEVEEDELEWDVGTESSIEVIIDNVWATDTRIAEWLWYLAQYSEKAISTWDGEYVNVSNDSVKLEALKTLAKMKGHFETKRKKKFTNKGIKYILIREPTKNPLL